jgi:nucleoside-diphosphate-sugar epimerase
MNILITGSDGCIGSQLKDYLENRNKTVYGTVFFHKPGYAEFFFDITDPTHFNHLPDTRFDAVIHTIGIFNQQAPERLMRAVNTEGTKRMVCWAIRHQCRHFIFLSSVSVYGLKTMGHNRDEFSTRRSRGILALPYMRTKALAEIAIEKSGVQYTILRLPAVIGNNDTFLSPTIISWLKSRKFFLCGNKNQIVSLLAVKNAAPVIEKLLEAGPQNDVFNCCDHHVGFHDLVKEYAKCLSINYKPEKRSLSGLPFHLHDKAYLLILSFSRFGAHFPDNKLHAKIPHDHRFTWQQAVKEAVEGYARRDSAASIINPVGLRPQLTLGDQKNHPHHFR